MPVAQASQDRAARETPDPPAKVSRWEAAALLAIVAVFLILCASMIERHPPLGHDEAVYAVRARYLAGEEVHGAYWAPYRAPGLPALMSLANRVSDSDPGMRAVPLLLAAGVLLLTWYWARRLFGGTAALFAVGLVAVAPGFMQWAWQIGVDIPATFFGLSAIVVFTVASSGERVSRWAYAAIPLAMAAAYTRFGAPILVGAGMSVAALAHWRAVRASLGRTVLVAAGTLGSMVAVLYVPAMTGSKIAPAKAFADRQVAKDLPWWNAYRDFADIAPDVLGPVVGILAGVGIMAAVAGVLTKRIALRPAVMAFGTFVVFILGLGYGLAQGFVQYLTPSLPFLLAFVGAGLAFLLRALPRAAVVAVAVALFGAGAIVAYGEADVSADSLDTFARLRTASLRTAEVTGEGCAIISSYSPQVLWYSHCTVFTFPSYAGRDNEPATRAEAEALMQAFYTQRLVPLPGDGPFLLMMLERGKRQPVGALLEYLDEKVGAPLLTVGSPGDGRARYVVVSVLPNDVS